MEGLSPITIPCLLLLFCLGCKCLASEFEVTQTATVKVDATPEFARKVPETLFGVFFEVRQQFLGRCQFDGVLSELSTCYPLSSMFLQ
jgi:hypothetical protein